MLLTPLALVAADRWWIPRLAGAEQAHAWPRSASRRTRRWSSPAAAATARSSAACCYANGIQPTLLDHDAESIEAFRRFGWRVFYGDATRLDLLRIAGAGRAKVLVLAIDDIEQSLACAKVVLRALPAASRWSPARATRPTTTRCASSGVTLIERETFDSALMSARSVLEALGWRPHQARTLAMRFRRYNVDQLAKTAPHWKDEAKLIAVARQGRAQLEELFAQERAAATERGLRGGWSAGQAGGGAPGGSEAGDATPDGREPAAPRASTKEWGPLHP